MQHPIYEIEVRIKEYLAGGISLDDLRLWFRETKGPLLALPCDLQASREAGLLELGFNEMRDGALGESEFRDLLSAEVDTELHHVIQGNPEIALSDSLTTTHSHSVVASTEASGAGLQETLADIPA